jgi:hypothetical protein
MSGFNYFMITVLKLADAVEGMYETQRKINISKATAEAKIAAENNKAMLLDLKIEREKLEIERLELKNLKSRKNLGLSKERFEPISYE